MTALGRSATVNDQAARGQDREGARPHDPAVGAAARGGGDSV